MIVCAGTDGGMAARQIERIATGWRLRAVGEPPIVQRGAQAPEDILALKHSDEAPRRLFIAAPSWATRQRRCW